MGEVAGALESACADGLRGRRRRLNCSCSSATGAARATARATRCRRRACGARRARGCPRAAASAGGCSGNHTRAIAQGGQLARRRPRHERRGEWGLTLLDTTRGRARVFFPIADESGMDPSTRSAAACAARPSTAAPVAATRRTSSPISRTTRRAGARGVAMPNEGPRALGLRIARRRTRIVRPRAWPRLRGDLECRRPGPGLPPFPCRCLLLVLGLLASARALTAARSRTSRRARRC